MIWRLAVAIPVLFFSAVLGMWAEDRDPPSQAISAQVLTETIRPGDQLRILYTVRRWRSCQIKIDRLLFDAAGERYVLEDLDFSASPGALGEATYTVGITIPRRFAAGAGRYRAVSTYICNPLHHIWPIIGPAPEVEFHVSGDPLPADVLPVEVSPVR
jgi:hypothetical protein